MLTGHRRSPHHSVAQEFDVLLPCTQNRQLRSGSDPVVDPRAVRRRAHDRIDSAVLQRKAPTVTKSDSDVDATVVVVAMQARGQLCRRGLEVSHDLIKARVEQICFLNPFPPGRIGPCARCDQYPHGPEQDRIEEGRERAHPGRSLIDRLRGGTAVDKQPVHALLETAN